MNIFRILGNALVFFLNSKQRKIIRKQKQIRKQKRERTLPGPYLQPKWLGQPTSSSPVVFLPLPGGRRVPDARTHAPRPPPASCRFPLVALGLPRDATQPRPLSPLSHFPLWPSLPQKQSATERARRRRSPYPRPPPPPRLSELSKSSASSASSSSTILPASDALLHRHRRRFRHRPPRLLVGRFAAVSASPSPLSPSLRSL